MVTKSTRNTGKLWTPKDEQQLKCEAKGNTPTRVIGIHLGRTAKAIQAKASELGVSLKPTNRSPYGTKNKK
jgi:hypothetical protein